MFNCGNYKYFKNYYFYRLKIITCRFVLLDETTLIVNVNAASLGHRASMSTASRADKSTVRFSPGYLAAAGARNFNIRRGSSELAITESRGGIDPPRRRVVDGRQHMLSLSLIKFL